MQERDGHPIHFEHDVIPIEHYGGVWNAIEGKLTRNRNRHHPTAPTKRLPAKPSRQREPCREPQQLSAPIEPHHKPGRSSLLTHEQTAAPLPARWYYPPRVS
jgi:hypothetical protein